MKRCHDPTAFLNSIKLPVTLTASASLGTVRLLGEFTRDSIDAALAPLIYGLGLGRSRCAIAGRVAITAAAAESPLPVEDRYKLWLRYAPPGEIAENYRKLIRQVVVPSKSATGQIIRDEFSAARKSLLGRKFLPTKMEFKRALIVGTPKTSDAISKLNLDRRARQTRQRRLPHPLDPDRRTNVTVIASESEIGALYGAFHFLG